MALTCPSNLSGVNLGFSSFIDCSSISINYDQMGLATINFVVISVSAEPSTYTTLTFGGVTFNGFLTNIEVKRMSGTLVYEQRYTFIGSGC